MKNFIIKEDEKNQIINALLNISVPAYVAEQTIIPIKNILLSLVEEIKIDEKITKNFQNDK